MNKTSVYVHFPWCARKCPYCDFISFRKKGDEIDHEGYANAVINELSTYRGDFKGRQLSSIFIGGGTPSMWAGEQMGRALNAITEAFDERVDDLEITAECNPASLGQREVDSLALAGVNRVSIGVQSLDNDRLGFLGRLHDRDGALAAVERAVKGFQRVSADLMFGMPGQTLQQLKGEVDCLLHLGLRHVSAYALTIEPGTQFGELHRLGKLSVAEEHDYVEMFNGLHDYFAQHGLQHYEVSNYATPTETSRHNQHYWRGGDYLALGCAAVGCLTKNNSSRRYRNQSDPQKYLDSQTVEWEENLSAADLVREALMLGLRTLEGVDLAEVEARTGLDPVFGRERELETLVCKGEMLQTDDCLRVPQEHWVRLDSVVRAVF